MSEEERAQYRPSLANADDGDPTSAEASLTLNVDGHGTDDTVDDVHSA